MNTQPSSTPDKESQLTLELLQVIDNNDDISQRYLAQEMGVALGLANSYLKRCVKKGLIKIKTAPANRYLYYLTPQGFAEKARLTGEFLSTSLALFRQSGDVYTDVFAQLESDGSRTVVFAGLSDLTEIAYLRALKSSVALAGVWQPGLTQSSFFDVSVVSDLKDLPSADAVVLTSLEQTNELLARLQEVLPAEQVIVPSLLLNMNYRTEADA